MTLPEIREYIHKLALTMRSMSEYANTPNFIEAHNRADAKVRTELETTLTGIKIPDLRDWNKPTIELYTASMADLRQEARLRQIYNYSRLSKSELIRALSRKEQG